MNSGDDMNETLAGCQGVSDAIARAGCPLSKMPPAPAPQGLVPACGATFPSAFSLPWFREDAEGLHRLFTRVEQRRAQGLSLNEALRHRWYGTRFHSAPRVKVRRSLSTLRKLYYYWRSHGQPPKCIAARFISKLPSVPPEVLRGFLTACATAGVTHFSREFKLADTKGFSRSRVLAALPDQAVKLLRDIFLARRRDKIKAQELAKAIRRQLRLARRQAETEIRKLEIASRREFHRLLAADATRNRKLDKLVGSFIARPGGGGMGFYLFRERPACSRHWYNLQGTSARGGQAGFKGRTILAKGSDCGST
jgi:hypothetical protein